MNRTTAYKLAIEALRKAIKPHAFNANLFVRGLVTPATQRDYEIKARYEQAIQVLEEEKDKS